MTDQDDLRNLIRRHHRRLQLLKEQQASFGPLHTPIHILTEIEDTQAEIHVLQTEMAEIENDADTLAQRVEEQRQRIAEGLNEIHHQAATATGRSTDQQRLRMVGRRPIGLVDHFKDRRREQEQIGHLLAEPTTRLVSIIGHGGMGKTALASKVLRDLEQHRWTHTDDDISLDGIVYLSTRTAGISLERLFLDCAKLLGGESEKRLTAIWTNPQLKTEDKIARLLEALKNGRYVILLDNLEDLLDDQGQFVDEELQLFFDQSLTSDHGARLLVTSRITLAFKREVMRFDRQVKLLEGLPIPDGVALLRELDPNGDYGLRDAPKEELTQAVSLVHGVPRALEVIAGILANDPFSSLAEVIEQFYEQEDVVQALIEENYKRLDNNCRRVIEALAVFKRPVPPLAVDYSLEPFVPGLDVPGILRRLTQTNIVTIDRATKMVTLHPIDQDFAYSQMPDESDSDSDYTRQALERRTADYYVQLRTPEATWKTIDDLQPQLVEFEHRLRSGEYAVAFNVLESIDDYLNRWGYFNRLAEMHKEISGRLTDPRLQIANLNSLGRTCHVLGQLSQAIKCHEQGMIVAREIGDRELESIALGEQGYVYHHQGELTKAIGYFNEALTIARKIGNRRIEGEYLSHMGRTYRRLGNFDKAIEYLQESLHIARETGDLQSENTRLNQLSFVYRTLGKLEEARKNHQKALAIARTTGDRWQEGSSLVYLGVVSSDLGQIEQAIEYLEQALFIDREIGELRGQGISLGFLGQAYYRLGLLEQAIEFFKQDLALMREVGDAWGESICLAWLARAMVAVGDLSKAHQLGLQALELNMPDTIYPASLVLGIVLLHWHKPSAEDFFADTAARCQSILENAGLFYELRYILATALAGQAVCNPLWIEEAKRPELLAPALTEYQRAMEICAAPGVVQDAIRDLKLIQAAGIEGLEPVFELLASALEKQA